MRSGWRPEAWGLRLEVLLLPSLSSRLTPHTAAQLGSRGHSRHAGGVRRKVIFAHFSLTQCILRMCPPMNAKTAPICACARFDGSTPLLFLPNPRFSPARPIRRAVSSRLTQGPFAKHKNGGPSGWPCYQCQPPRQSLVRRVLRLPFNFQARPRRVTDGGGHACACERTAHGLG